ncbi:MAG: pectate lyase-like adhesive domain-containing protein, partial [Lachnospiraceae bacterium]
EGTDPAEGTDPEEGTDPAEGTNPAEGTDPAEGSVSGNEPEHGVSTLPSLSGNLEVDNFADLKAALEADTTNTIKLTKDITYEDEDLTNHSVRYAVTISAGNHTLDLNGYTLTFLSGDEENAPYTEPLYVDSEVTLTIKSTAEAYGQLNYRIRKEDFGGFFACLRSGKNSTLNLEHIKIKVEGGYWLRGIYSNSSHFTMKDCEVDTPGHGVDLVYGKDSLLSNCTVKSANSHAIYVSGGSNSTSRYDCASCTLDNVSAATYGNTAAVLGCAALHNDGGEVYIKNHSSFYSENGYGIYLSKLGDTRIEDATITGHTALCGCVSSTRTDENLKIYGATLKVTGADEKFINIQDGEALDAYIPASSKVMIGETEITQSDLSEKEFLAAKEDNLTCTITDYRSNPAYQIKDAAVTMTKDVWGKSVTDSTLASTTTADAYIENISWEKYNLGKTAGIQTTGTVSKGNDYKATIRVSSKTKYFPEDVTRTVTLNGTVWEEYYIKNGDLYLEYWFESPVKLKDISLTVVPPAVGEPFATDKELETEISYSSDIYNKYAFNGKLTNSRGGTWNTEDAVAKAGKVYYLTVPMSTDNYYFDLSENLTVSVNAGNDTWQPVSVDLERKDLHDIVLVLGFLPVNKLAIHVTDGVALNTKGEIITKAMAGELITLSPAVKEDARFAGWEGLDDVEFGNNFRNSAFSSLSYMIATPKLYMPNNELYVEATYNDASETYIDSVNLDIPLYVNYSISGTTSQISTGSSEYYVSDITWYELDEGGKLVATTDTRFLQEKEYIAKIYLSSSGLESRSFTETSGVLNTDLTTARTMTGTVNGNPIMDCGGTVKSGKRLGFVTCYLGQPKYRIETNENAQIESYGNTADGTLGEKFTLTASYASGGKRFKCWQILGRATDEDDYQPIFDESQLPLTVGSSLTDHKITVEMNGYHYKLIPLYATEKDIVNEIDVTGIGTPKNGEVLTTLGAVGAPDGVNILMGFWAKLDENFEFPATPLEFAKAAEDKMEIIESDSYKAKIGERYCFILYLTPKDGKILPDKGAVTVSCGGRKASMVYTGSNSAVMAFFDFGMLCPEEGLYISPIGDYRYTGSAIKPQINAYCNGVKLKEGTDYSVSYKNNVNYVDPSADVSKQPTVTITGKKNYKGSYSRTFTIKSAIFGETEGIEIKDITVTANGRQIFAKPVVTYNGKKVSPSEYTVTYVGENDKNNFCKPGNYTIRISGNDKNFVKSVDITETVVEKLSAKNLTFNVKEAKTYTGSDILLATHEYGLKNGDGKKLTENTDYTVTYKNNRNKGTATVTFTGKGLYVGSISKTFKIEAAPIAVKNADKTVTRKAKVTGFTDTVTYEKGGVKPDSFAVILNGNVLKEGRDYTLSYKNYANAAKAGDPKPPTVIVTGKGNYTGSFEMYYTIKEASLSLADSSGYQYKAEDICYKDAKNNFITKVSIIDKNGKALSAGTDYDRNFTYYWCEPGSGWQIVTGDRVTMPDEENTLLMNVSITGKGNYSDSLTCSYTIHRYSAKQMSVSTLPAKTYTGAPVTLTASELVVTDSKSKATLTEGTDYTVRYEKNTNAGTATVYITGMDAYCGEIKKTFKINKLDLATIPAEDLVFEYEYVQYYDGSAKKPAVKVLWGGYLKEGQDYTVSYKNNVNASIYISDPKKMPAIVVTGKGNFTGKVEKVFVIHPKYLEDSDITMTAKEVLYKDAKNNFATTVVLTDPQGKKLTAGKDYEKELRFYIQDEEGKTKLIDTDRIDMGGKEELILWVVAYGKGNYVGAKAQQYRIYTKDISKATVAKIDSQTFTGKAICPEPSLTYDGKTLVKGKDYTVEYQKNKDIGTATIIIRGIGAYGGEKKVTFKITTPYELTWWEKVKKALSLLMS